MFLGWLLKRDDHGGNIVCDQLKMVTEDKIDYRSIIMNNENINYYY